MASDLLLAVQSHDTQPNVIAPMHFRWEGDVLSSARALRAFVAKQLADSGARLVLCAAQLLSQIGDELQECAVVELPALDELIADGARKRELWQQIQNHQS